MIFEKFSSFRNQKFDVLGKQTDFECRLMIGGKFLNYPNLLYPAALADKHTQLLQKARGSLPDLIKPPCLATNISCPEKGGIVFVDRNKSLVFSPSARRRPTGIPGNRRYDTGRHVSVAAEKIPDRGRLAGRAAPIKDDYNCVSAARAAVATSCAALVKRYETTTKSY